MSERFQVDLSGMVDLLSHHLYSGPHVFMRELLQNAVDATTARRTLDPAAPATVRLAASEDGGMPRLEVVDSGIGLTAEEARHLLSTIGRSSKRDPALGLARSEFIGQFGIGMLAAFMVADTIEVVSASARPNAVPMRWVGCSDGTFTVEELPGADVASGTTVRLTARRGMEQWLSQASVVDLATEYGSLLPLDIAVQVPVEGAQPLWRRITEPALPWRTPHRSPAARERALTAYCERVFGFTPLGHIDLDLPVVGVSGVAFILPQSVAPRAGQHRVYAKRMLVGSRVGGVLPDWAFFTRAVIDTELLAPTASREQLHADDVLVATREALGEQLKAWAVRTLTMRSSLARRFLETHHLALRALALADDEILDLVADVVPYETTEGQLTLSAAAAGGELLYASTTESYQRVSAVARAQGLVVVNAGYVYDADVIARLGKRARWNVRELTSADMVQILELPDPVREAVTAEAVVRARQILEPEDCDVLVRRFAPDIVPAMLLRDREGESRRELEREREETPGLWSGLLDSFAGDATVRTRTLVLNDNASVVRQLLDASDPDSEVFTAGLRSLYLSAVMLAGEGLRSGEVVSLNESLSVLLASSLGAPDTSHEGGAPS